MAIINKIVSFATRYTDDIARCAKTSWLTPANIKAAEIKGLKFAPELVDDTLKLSEKSTFIKKLSSLFKKTEVKLKLNNIDDVYTKFVGSQGGSNPAFWATNQRTGDLFYIKSGSVCGDVNHLKSEFLASKLYNLAGIKTPKIELGKLDDGATCLVSKFEEGLKPLNKAEAQKAFGVDAWLANWDGVLEGNTFSKAGSCIKVDCGGALKYRALGEQKRNFSDNVEELVTLLSKNHPESESIYRDMTRETAIASLKRVAEISDKSILETVGDRELAKTLINRKKYITEFLDELVQRPTSNKKIATEFQEIAQVLETGSGKKILHPKFLGDDIAKCYKELEALPSTEYLSKSLLQQVKGLEKQGGELSRESLIEYFATLSRTNLVGGTRTKSHQELYKNYFTRLKELAEKTPIEEGESVSKYCSRLIKLRQKRVKQLEAGRISFIKSRLRYDKPTDIPAPKPLTDTQREQAIKALEKQRIQDEKLEIFLIPKLSQNATDEEIFIAWRNAHVAGQHFADDALEETVMALGGRYDSSLRQVRTTRFEEVMENTYKNEFKYEPTYRWMQFNKPEEFIESLPKRGGIYELPQKQCCSTHKHYAEVDFNDDNQFLNVKLVLHPKSKTSKAYLLGTDNEVVYPKGQQFELIDKELIEYINPKTKMGCQRYEVHLQEV